MLLAVWTDNKLVETASRFGKLCGLSGFEEMRD